MKNKTESGYRGNDNEEKIDMWSDEEKYYRVLIHWGLCSNGTGC